MGFEERTAQLVQDLRNSTVTQWPKTIYEILQIDSIEIFHRIVEHSFRSSSVIVNRDGMRIVQIASNLNFLFESADGCLIDSLYVQ